MAIHNSYASLVKSGLKEMIEIAELCIEKRKTPDKWGPDNGCFGIPAAILLLSIADSIGSYVIGINPKKHFDVLNVSDFYNLKLKDCEISEIYKLFRNYLTHNTGLGVYAVLELDNINSHVYTSYPKRSRLALIPFLKASKPVVEKFINLPDSIIENSKVYEKFLKEEGTSEKEWEEKERKWEEDEKKREE